MKSTVKVIAYNLPERVDRSGAAKAHGAVFKRYCRLVVKDLLFLFSRNVTLCLESKIVSFSFLKVEVMIFFINRNA